MGLAEQIDSALLQTIGMSQLSEKNKARCLASYKQSLSDWSETDWSCALAGETGELCNLLKKRLRGDAIPDNEVGKELADIVIYADLLAQRIGLDLAQCIKQKFNEVSMRVNSDIFLK